MRSLSPADLGKMTFQRLGLPEPWRGVLGNITPDAQGLIHGPAGSGKSTWALELAALMSGYGPVLYALPEEGFGPTTADRVRRLGLNDDERYGNLILADARTPEELAAAIDQHRPYAVFVDSQTHMDDGTGFGHALAEWCRKYGVGLWMVAHQTKGGTYRGSTKLAHDPDIVIGVKEGVVKADKNRFGGHESMPVPFDAEALAEVMPRKNPSMSVDCAAPQSARCKAMFARLGGGERPKPKQGARPKKQSAPKKKAAPKKRSAPEKRTQTTAPKRGKTTRASAPKRQVKKAASGPDAATQATVLQQLKKMEQSIDALDA